MGKNVKTPIFLRVAATVEKASTYVFAERLIRNAEVEGSNPFCSTKLICLTYLARRVPPISLLSVTSTQDPQVIE